MNFENPKGLASIVGHKPMSERFRRGVGRRIGIEEDADRTWEPEQKASDKLMSYVLDMLIEENSIRQADICKRLRAELGLSKGYANAVTTASLLRFKEEGWIEENGKERRSRIWRVVS